MGLSDSLASVVGNRVSRGDLNANCGSDGSGSMGLVQTMRNQDADYLGEVEGYTLGMRTPRVKKSWPQEDGDCEYGDLDHHLLRPNSTCPIYHGHVEAPAVAGDDLYSR